MVELVVTFSKLKQRYLSTHIRSDTQKKSPINALYQKRMTRGCDKFVAEVLLSVHFITVWREKRAKYRYRHSLIFTTPRPDKLFCK